MSILSPTNRRRAAAAALIPLLVLLSACGVTYDFKIKKDDTVDFTYITWDSTGEGYITEAGCSEEGMGDNSDIPKGTEITYKFTEKGEEGNPTCEVVATNIPISEFHGNTSITHEGDTYVFNMKKNSDMEEYKSSDVKSTLSVTFPGKVTEHSGNSTVKGNTVTWDFLDEQGDLHAVGGDGSGSMALLLIGGGVLLLVVVGAIVAVVLVNNSKKRKAAQPAAPMPGPGPQPGAPMPGPGQPPFPGQR